MNLLSSSAQFAPPLLKMLNFTARLRCFVDRNGLHPLLASGSDVIDRLHAIARDEKHRMLCRKGGFDPRMGWLWGVIRRPLWLVIAICDSVRQFSSPEKECARDWTHFFFDVPRMVHLALRFNLSPVHYYVYDLHRRPLAPDFVRRLLTGWEGHYLLRRLTRLGKLDVARLDDKIRFAEFCGENGLATIPLIDLNHTANLAPKDLFAKPAKTSGGIGCQPIPYDERTGHWTIDSELIPAEQLLQALRKLYGDAPFLLQYSIRNHPDMRWMSERVLSTVRVVTAWDPHGEACILGATIRFPGSADAWVDNTSQGGLSAPVDPHTGVISGPAIRWEQDRPEETPLGSDRSFVGFQLPDWNEARRLLLDAHRAADDFNFLGWDLVLTPEGPRLLECNVWSDLELIQVPQEVPLLSGLVLECLQAETRLWDSPEVACPLEKPLDAIAPITPLTPAWRQSLSARASGSPPRRR